MIVNHISNLGRYFGSHEVDLINSFLLSLDLETAKTGEWKRLDKEDLKVILLNKSNFKEHIFEHHQKYQDIHVILRGTDTMYYGNPLGSVITNPYSEKDDFELKQAILSSVTELKEGSFAIIDPGELHTNKINGDGTMKVVFKKRFS